MRLCRHTRLRMSPGEKPSSLTGEDRSSRVEAELEMQLLKYSNSDISDKAQERSQEGRPVNGFLFEMDGSHSCQESSLGSDPAGHPEPPGHPDPWINPGSRRWLKYFHLFLSLWRDPAAAMASTFDLWHFPPSSLDE